MILKGLNALSRHLETKHVDFTLISKQSISTQTLTSNTGILIYLNGDVKNRGEFCLK